MGLLQKWCITAFVSISLLPTLGQTPVFAGCIVEQLNRNFDLIAGNKFPTYRNFDDYLNFFGPVMGEVITAIPKNGHWVDSGAGAAYVFWNAAHESWRGIRVENLTAIGFVKPEGTIANLPGVNYRYLHGRYLESIPAGEIRAADVITDVYGPFAYARNIDEVLRKYLEVLKKDGSAFIAFDSRKTTVNGHGDGLGQYLRSIRGAEVMWHKVLPDGVVGIQIKKTSDDFFVPSLQLDDFIAAPDRFSDPARRYRTEAGPAAKMRSEGVILACLPPSGTAYADVLEDLSGKYIKRSGVSIGDSEVTNVGRRQNVVPYCGNMVLSIRFFRLS